LRLSIGDCLFFLFLFFLLWWWFLWIEDESWFFSFRNFTRAATFGRKQEHLALRNIEKRREFGDLSAFANTFYCVEEEFFDVTSLNDRREEKFQRKSSF